MQSCKNTAQLFVSTRNSLFTVVFTQRPSDEEGTADSLGPIGWSPNGRWLAAELALTYYGSDYGLLELLLYDSRSGRVIRPDVIGAIGRTFRKRCSLGYRSISRFDEQNRVVVRVADWQDDNGRESYCITGEEEWLFNPDSGTVRRH